MVESQPSKLLVAGSIPVSRSRDSRLVLRWVFEQATIKVEKEKEYEELKGAISHAFSPERIEKFLKRVNREGVRVRDWDSVLARGILEQVAEGKAGSGAGIV